MLTFNFLNVKTQSLNLRFYPLLIGLWCLLLQIGLAEKRRLFLLHTNDIHGHIEAYREGGLERIALFSKLLRRLHPGEVLLLAGGDTSLGTPLSGQFHGKPTAEIMASMSYDAVTLGNHEFNWGQDKMRALTKAMGAPVLCANLVSEAGSHPPYPSHSVVEKNGIKLAIVGLVAPDTARRAPAHATKGWQFLPSEMAFESVLPTLPDVDLVIGLTHLGLEADRKLASRVPEIDLIVGGHSHTALHQPAFVGETPIVQSGSYARYLGYLELLVDTESNNFQIVEQKLIPMGKSHLDQDAIGSDLEAHQIVERYAKTLRPILRREVALVRSKLSKAPSAGQYETLLGTFISDVFRNQAKTDIALYNRGGVRFDMEKGPLTVEDVHKLFPFDDPVAVLELNGIQLREVLEQGTVDGQGPISISGLVAQICHGQVRDIKVNGRPLENKKLYTLATTSFLAGGGDGMASLAGLRKLRTLPFTRDVLLEYLETVQNIEAPDLGRLRVVGP